MIYYIIAAVLLLGGCAQDNTYSPKGWPRAIVIESALDNDAEIERVEMARRSIDMINKHVGAAVFQLAVTNDIEAAGCDTIVMKYVDWIDDGFGVHAKETVRGTYTRNMLPCQAFVQLRFKIMHGNDPVPVDETVIVHELMHNLLGADHDTERPSVFMEGTGCLVSDPEVGYKQADYCARRYDSEITQSLVDRIRKKMGLPADPEPH